MKVELRWAAFAVLVAIGAWKTSDFAMAVAPHANDWALRFVAGVLYFAVYLASEIWPDAVGPAMVRITRLVLFLLLIVVVMGQTLDSTYVVITDGMEYARLSEARGKIDAFVGDQLRQLYLVYGRLLAESGCTGRNARRSRAGSAGCETLQRNREEVLNAPRTFRLDPPDTNALRESLKGQLEQLDALRKKVPANRRKFEVYPIFDLGTQTYSYVAVAGWAVTNYNRLPAQALFGQLARNVMILMLTIVAGLWCQLTSHGREEGA